VLAIGGQWPTSARQRGSMSGHPARIGKGSPQQRLDLRVEAAELIRRPPTQRVMHGRIEAEQDRLAVSVHE
jgi:hypothetical protein